MAVIEDDRRACGAPKSFSPDHADHLPFQAKTRPGLPRASSARPRPSRGAEVIGPVRTRQAMRPHVPRSAVAIPTALSAIAAITRIS